MPVAKKAPDACFTEQKIAQVFGIFAREYEEAFPKKLAKLFVTIGETPVYVSPVIAARVSAYPQKIKQRVATRQAYMKRKTASGCAGYISVRFNALPYISLHTAFTRAPPPNSIFAPRFTRAMRDIFTFDHEIGHLLCKGGMGGGHRGECIADAFAALRHIQRFGTKTEMASDMATNRTDLILWESPPIHYTTAVFQKIENMLTEEMVDIQKLSLRETATLASQIGTNYALSPAAIRKIGRTFKPLSKKTKFEFNQVFVKETLRFALKHKNNPHIYRAAKRLLTPKQFSIELVTLAAQPDYKKMLDDMTKHEKEKGFTLDASAAIDKKRENAPLYKIRRFFSK